MNNEAQLRLQRVRKEYDAVQDNIVKLNNYLQLTDRRDINDDEMMLLSLQLDAMRSYRTILDRRIHLMMNK